MHKIFTCSSNCWTTCIWTRHCAVLLSSSMCSLFKCLPIIIWKWIKNGASSSRRCDNHPSTAYNRWSSYAQTSFQLWARDIFSTYLRNAWKSPKTVSQPGHLHIPFPYRGWLLCVFSSKQPLKRRQKSFIWFCSGTTNGACEASCRITINR